MVCVCVCLCVCVCVCVCVRTRGFVGLGWVQGKQIWWMHGCHTLTVRVNVPALKMENTKIIKNEASHSAIRTKLSFAGMTPPLSDFVCHDAFLKHFFFLTAFDAVFFTQHSDVWCHRVIVKDETTSSFLQLYSHWADITWGPAVRLCKNCSRTSVVFFPCESAMSIICELKIPPHVNDYISPQTQRSCENISLLYHIADFESYFFLSVLSLISVVSRGGKSTHILCSRRSTDTCVHSDWTYSSSIKVKRISEGHFFWPLL